nr:exodeoxyribonuclease VII large subunit [Liberibacter crescens]
MINSNKQDLINITEYSISELSSLIKLTIESNFSYVRVKGEVSGYRGPHSSGHAYFALKDHQARIEAVIWKGTFNKLKFLPEEGIEFILIGKITTFPGSSKYQIIIEKNDAIWCWCTDGSSGRKKEKV